jgi:hypothetical protein
MSEQEGYLKGINSLSDLSAKEYYELLGYVPDLRETEYRYTTIEGDVNDLPLSVDWRQENAVSDVKN